jgi:PDDEXK-like domain of unknown function (DUF3799)
MTTQQRLADGIYFDLPDEIYHADDALGSTDISRLIISPATYWAGSALNPNKPQGDEDATKAQILGRAYHVARLEPEIFDALYLREPIPADFPSAGFLSSDEKVKAQLKERGIQQTVSGETTLERAERLLADGYEGTIWPRVKALFEAELGQRVAISGKFYDDMMIEIGRLRNSPEIKALLSGGFAEVSIIYTDSNGIRCKVRLDYLRPDSWADFKTFDNSRGKVLDQAIADAFRYNRYYVQAVQYRAAVEQMRTSDLAIVGEATDDQKALIAAIKGRPAPLDCWYVFQEKGGIPNLLARRFEFQELDVERAHEIEAIVDPARQAEARAALSRNTGIFRLGLVEIARAKELWATYSQIYEPGQPWAPINAVGTIGDLDFNQFWLEGR